MSADEERTDLLTSGQFAAQTLLSAKALRIYGERELLAPHHVDPVNGYRYYTREQVRVGWLIGLLRSADLSLEQIGLIVHADPDTGLRRLEQAMAEQDRRAAANQVVLHRARLHLRQEETMTDIVPSLEGERPVLSVLRRMRPEQMDQIIPEEVRMLRRTAEDAGLTATGPPFGVFHAPITDDSDGPLEIVLPVDGLADSSGDVRSYRLAGGLTANRYAEGAETWFPEILALYDEVHSWITDAGRVPIGPPREIWHNSPHDPEPLRLTISWPYADPTP